MIISAAIPCYRSAKTVPAVVEELIAAITARPENDYQIILVNDYPADNTFDVIRGLCEKDPKIVGVNLSRNYGQTAAKMAALPYVTGDVLVYLDDDGQHPADQIYRLIDKLSEGYDLVYAHFPQKQHSLFKRLTSRLNSYVLELNGSKPRDIYISSYLAMNRTCIEALQQYHSPFPSMGGYLSHVVSRYANVEMEHRSRLAGQSNYTLKKLLGLWLTGFTNFSTVPLRLASFIGLGCAVLGFLSGVFIIIRKIVNPAIAAGYTSSIAVQLFIGGLIMALLGLCGEYIGRIYMTLSDMPQYHVGCALNVPPTKTEDHNAPHSAV